MHAIRYVEGLSYFRFIEVLREERSSTLGVVTEIYFALKVGSEFLERKFFVSLEDLTTYVFCFIQIINVVLFEYRIDNILSYIITSWIIVLDFEVFVPEFAFKFVPLIINCVVNSVVLEKSLHVSWRAIEFPIGSAITNYITS